MSPARIEEAPTGSRLPQSGQTYTVSTRSAVVVNSTCGRLDDSAASSASPPAGSALDPVRAFPGDGGD